MRLRGFAVTPRERVLAALRREPVDRVPIVEMGIDWNVIAALGLGGYFRTVRQLGLDGIAVNQALYLMGWRRLVLPRVKEYVDEWHVRSRFTGELLPIPVGHPISERRDLDRFVPPSPKRSPLLRAVSFVRRRAPNRAIVLLARSDFAASWYLCGMDELLVSYLNDPEFAHRLAEMVSDYSVELFRLAARAGVDVVYLTDDYAYKTGTLMGRGLFTEFILPYLTRAVGAVHDAGALCVKHTDGNVDEIIDLIVGTGVDAIGPLEPGAGNDLRAIQRRWGDRVAVVGNVDVDLLSRGSPREVAEATRDLVQALAPAGGHVLSSGNSVTSSVCPENYRVMVDAARAASCVRHAQGTGLRAAP